MRGIAPLLIVQYPGSRLYDTINAKHRSLDELRQWWNRGISFEVHDAETGEDVTRHLFDSASARRSIIRFRQDALGGVRDVPPSLCRQHVV